MSARVEAEDKSADSLIDKNVRECAFGLMRFKISGVNIPIHVSRGGIGFDDGFDGRYTSGVLLESST